MKIPLPDSLSAWLKCGLVVAGILGGLHTMIHAPDAKSLRNIEASSVVQRIRGLHRSRCAGGLTDDLQAILEEQNRRYFELTNREFRPGECRDGVWYNAAGAPG